MTLCAPGEVEPRGLPPTDPPDLPPDTPPDALLPIHEYLMADRPGICAVTGGYVYRGQDIPQLRGVYLYGDFCGAQVWALALEGGQVTDDVDLGLRVPQFASFGQDSAGELYVVSLQGPVYRLVDG